MMATLLVEQREQGRQRLLDDMDIDSALIQETVPPPRVARDRVIFREISGIPAGLARLSHRGFPNKDIRSVPAKVGVRYTLASEFPGSVVTARLSTDHMRPFTAVNGAQRPHRPESPTRGPLSDKRMRIQPRPATSVWPTASATRSA